MADPNKGLFDHQYGRFVADRKGAEGYNFQHQTAGNVPPPPVTFTQKLRWWTWDRWKRRKKIREERDRRLQQIIQLQSPKTPPSR